MTNVIHLPQKAEISLKEAIIKALEANSKHLQSLLECVEYPGKLSGIVQVNVEANTKLIEQVRRAFA